MSPMGTLLSVGLRTARFASLCSPMRKNSWFGTNFMWIACICAKCIEEWTNWTFAVVSDFVADWTCSLFVPKVSEGSCSNHWKGDKAAVVEVIVDEAWSCWQWSRLVVCVAAEAEALFDQFI